MLALGPGFFLSFFSNKLMKSRRRHAKPLLFLTHPAACGSEKPARLLGSRSLWNGIWAFPGLLLGYFLAAHERSPSLKRRGVFFCYWR